LQPNGRDCKDGPGRSPQNPAVQHTNGESRREAGFLDWWGRHLLSVRDYRFLKLLLVKPTCVFLHDSDAQADRTLVKTAAMLISK